MLCLLVFAEQSSLEEINAGQVKAFFCSSLYYRSKKQKHVLCPSKALMSKGYNHFFLPIQGTNPKKLFFIEKSASFFDYEQFFRCVPSKRISFSPDRTSQYYRQSNVTAGRLLFLNSKKLKILLTLPKQLLIQPTLSLTGLWSASLSPGLPPAVSLVCRRFSS